MSSSVSVRARALGEQPVSRLILKFAAPSIVAMLVMSLYNIVDQLFIGHGVGYLGNAATNIVFPVSILGIAISMLIGEGSTAFYSIQLGEKRYETAKQTAANALVMLCLIGLGFALACLFFLKSILGFFGATDAIMPYAVAYAEPIVWGIPFAVAAGGMNALIRANGSPAYAMLVMLSGAVINTILDPILIFTFDMGVGGAAIATAIAQFIGFLIALDYFVRRNGFGLERGHFRLRAGIVGKIASCGLPPSLSQLAIMIVIVVINKALVEHGDRSVYGAEICLAAHGITMKVNQILFSILIGLSMAAQPIIGYNFGARDFHRVKRAFFLAVGLAVGAGTLGFIAFFFFPQSIVALFGSENELYNEFARKCFRVFLFFAPLNGVTILAGTFFQSMAKVVRAATIQLSRQFAFMIPLVYFLSRWRGVDGVLLAGPVCDFASFVLAVALVAAEFRRMGETRPRPAADEAIEPDEATSASARLA